MTFTLEEIEQIRTIAREERLSTLWEANMKACEDEIAQVWQMANRG